MTRFAPWRAYLSWLPNALSLSRVGLGLAFPWIPGPWRFPAVVVAALSDALDGAASRALHARSHLGQLLDPIADKVFVLGVLVTFLIEGGIHPVEMGLLLLRDLAVLVAGFVFFLRGDTGAWRRAKPSLLGKLATAGIFAYFLALTWWEPPLLGFLVPVVILSALAAGDYLFRLKRQPDDTAPFLPSPPGSR